MLKPRSLGHLVTAFLGNTQGPGLWAQDLDKGLKRLWAPKSGHLNPRPSCPREVDSMTPRLPEASEASGHGHEDSQPPMVSC